MKEKAKKQVKIYHSLFSIVGIVVVMFAFVIRKDLAPHLAMLIGAVIATIVGFWLNYSWDEILDGILESITQSLEAIIILMMIGVLIGVWIISGVVPTMIFYGLKLIAPKIFLVSTLLICSFVSMAIGSWGTAGTIGIAFMGMSHVLGIPPAITAGAVVSGSYVGDRLSPLSDSCNLAAAVTEVNIFEYIKKMSKLSGIMFIFTLLAYGILGWNLVSADSSLTLNQLEVVNQVIINTFSPNIFALIPLVLLITCILKKVPAIPSMVIGSVAGGVYGIIALKVPAFEILNASYAGYVSASGNELIDTLFTAGGIESMLYAISMIVIAMMYGGAMEVSGQMEVLTKSFMNRINNFVSLTFTTVATATLVNVIIPDQYLGIALPGRMYAKEYDKRDIDRVELTMALGVGGSLTSSMIPWNTCGIFMASVLGVTAYDYFFYTFGNLFMLVGIIGYAVFEQRKHNYKFKQEKEMDKNLSSK